MSKHIGSSVDQFFAEDIIGDPSPRVVTAAKLPSPARRCWLWMLLPMAEQVKAWSMPTYKRLA